MRVTKVCEVCRKPYPSYAASDTIVCKPCRKHLRGKNRYRNDREKCDRHGIGLGTLRRFGLELGLFVYERDERKCVLCASENDLTIDHIDGQGRGAWERGEEMNNDPNNLRLLCRSCHGRISGRLGKGVKKGVLGSSVEVRVIRHVA